MYISFVPSFALVTTSITRWFVIAVIALPIMMGIATTICIAFGYFPALGGDSFTLAHCQQLFQQPGFWSAVWRTVTIGFSSTIISLVLVYFFLVFILSKPRVLSWCRVLLSPLLAVPHIAAALGLMYLLGASGMMGRLLHQIFDRNIDYIFAPDSYGFGMILALVIKEIPYLLLIALGIITQIPVDKFLTVARTLGYSKASAWFKVILPIVHRQMLLPVLVVLSFSLTSTEHNLLLLPRYATGLPGLIIDFYHHPDLSTQFLASCAILALIVLCLLSIGIWIFLSFLADKFFHLVCISNGKRDIACTDWLEKICFVCASLFLVFHVGALIVMIVWSFTRSWFYPNFWPDSLTFQYWIQFPQYLDAITSTLAIAFCSVVISLVLSIAYFESAKHTTKDIGERGQKPLSKTFSHIPPLQKKSHHITHKMFATLIYLPLIIPQMGFVFGLKFLLSLFDTHDTILFVAVVWGHVLFVFPYYFLSVVTPYQRFDHRLMLVGRTLGRSRFYTTLKVKWPLLKAPILFGCAIGASVSFSLYLPTLILGGGRLNTLTVETVALASGGNFRFIALFVVLQTFISFFVFFLAIFSSRKKTTPLFI